MILKLDVLAVFVVEKIKAVSSYHLLIQVTPVGSCVPELDQSDTHNGESSNCKT